eukprot:CAMPEP_0202447404 /NCGR_PEP_ID=MMETSP1360-20130828/6174_1 /ASSEMBLY_ACC=CAM_ASM_000848 /TAXON_ID=515479 /ORGANISM="Licmophora paradoxa, Strain CCMP2313" /LENGTH=163 /DNA_ID=CAMNT_0049064487 /DNA_START=66 /DNA_END=557 /DNA_ORIENTATION=+
MTQISDNPPANTSLSSLQSIDLLPMNCLTESSSSSPSLLNLRETRQPKNSMNKGNQDRPNDLDKNNLIQVLPPCNDEDHDDDENSLSEMDLLFETDEVGFNESRNCISMPNIERSQFNDSLVFGHCSAPTSVRVNWDDDLLDLEDEDDTEENVTLKERKQDQF